MATNICSESYRCKTKGCKKLHYFISDIEGYPDWCNAYKQEINEELTPHKIYKLIDWDNFGEKLERNYKITSEHYKNASKMKKISMKEIGNHLVIIDENTVFYEIQKQNLKYIMKIREQFNELCNEIM